MTGPATLGVEGRLGFTITVPDTWFELDVHPATREQSIRLLVEERVRGNEVMWEQRRGVMKLLLEQASAAYDAGATYCASFAIPTDEGPITGSLTISLVMNPEGDEESLLSDSFVPVPLKGGKGPEAEPYTDVSMATIDGIECPRSTGIEDAPVGEGTFIRNVSMLTAVPVPDFNRVFLISCSSPVIPLAEPLLDLFDAATGTFRVVRVVEESDVSAG